MKMFLHYDSKDKKKFVLFNFMIFTLMALMFYLSLKITKTELPTVTNKFEVGIGFALILLTFIVVTTDLIKVILKVNAIGFILALAIFYFLRLIIDTLVVSLALALIPVLINDLAIKPYFHFLNNTKYFEIYWKLKG